MIVAFVADIPTPQTVGDPAGRARFAAQGRPQPDDGVLHRQRPSGRSHNLAQVRDAYLFRKKCDHIVTFTYHVLSCMLESLVAASTCPMCVRSCILESLRPLLYTPRAFGLVYLNVCGHFYIPHVCALCPHSFLRIARARGVKLLSTNRWWKHDVS